jgi:hypothetical protein
MAFKTSKKQHVTQLTVMLENKVGHLNDLMILLSHNHIHLIALSLMDTTDIVSVRMIVNYTDQTRDLLHVNNIHFYEHDVVVLEIDSESDLKRVTCALVEAEINLHYTYPLLMRPNGKTGLVIRCEEPDLAEEILRKHHIVVLKERDIAR